MNPLDAFLLPKLSERDRLRRAIEFIDLVQQRVDREIFDRLCEEALDNLKGKYCEQCSLALLLGKPNHRCLIATCPNQ